METQLNITCHQMKPPIPGTVYIKPRCWPKKHHGNPQITKAIAKVTGYSPQTDSKAQLLEAIVGQYLIEHSEVKLVPTYSFCPY